MFPAVLFWPALYVAYGEHPAAAIPLSYAVVTGVDFALLLRFRRFEVFRNLQQSLILVLPMALQLTLGGYVGGSAVILWSFLAVLLALLFGTARSATWWFAGFVAGLAAAAVVQPDLALDNGLPPALVTGLFALNVATVSLISFAVLLSFVTDRRRLRALEKAFLEQELALRQSERMATLGTLSAGVAHELNNPAAAARRASEQLLAAVGRLEDAHVGAGVPPLTPRAGEVLRSLQHTALERSAGARRLDPLERSDRESAVASWLDDLGVPDDGELAASLVDQGLDRSELAGLVAALDPDEVSAVLARAASAFAVRELAGEIGEASRRVSEVVSALRSYSSLGRTSKAAVDVHAGLDDTLVILRAKLKEGIEVRRRYAGVLVVPAFGGELNQVWTNLIDNAVDAMGGRGVITIRTRREDGWAVVEIEDDGPGIPESVLPRVFDPFFTTKEPGRGTGLGLSTSYSIVTQRHGGSITVASRPGLTRFTVRLPLVEPAPADTPAGSSSP
jgi:signal transduction histidine kinase